MWHNIKKEGFNMSYEEIIELVKGSIKKTAAKAIENHIAVEFDIYGEGEGAFYVEVNNGALMIEPYEYYDRDAKLITTAEELAKLIKGEKTPEESVTDGITMVEGDVNAALELLKLAKPPQKKASVKKQTTAKAETKKPATKKSTKKATKAEKEIVDMTKASKKSTVAKDIKK